MRFPEFAEITLLAQMVRARIVLHTPWVQAPPMIEYTSMWIEKLGFNGGCQEVSGYHTRGESEESIAHK